MIAADHRERPASHTSASPSDAAAARSRDDADGECRRRHARASARREQRLVGGDGEAGAEAEEGAEHQQRSDIGALRLQPRGVAVSAPPTSASAPGPPGATP